MATIKIDDVTGTQTDVKSVSVTFDGTKHTLDLSDASREAFAAFLADPVSGRAGLISLLCPVPNGAQPARRSGSRSGSTAAPAGDGAKAKAWARTQPSLREKVSERGRAGNEILAAWEAAGKPEPADTPAQTPAS